MKKILFAAAALALLTITSPAIEASQDAIVADAVITKTCWDRHGFDFISRWSCRSSLQRVGVAALALGCAFRRGDSDLCNNFTQLSAENKRIR